MFLYLINSDDNAESGWWVGLDRVNFQILRCLCRSVSSEFAADRLNCTKKNSVKLFLEYGGEKSSLLNKMREDVLGKIGALRKKLAKLFLDKSKQLESGSAALLAETCSS